VVLPREVKRIICGPLAGGIRLSFLVFRSRRVKFTGQVVDASCITTQMAIDITWYLRKHANDLRHASHLAQHYVEKYNEEKCCDECAVTISGGHYKLDDKGRDGHKVRMNRLLDMVETVLFSSGYYGGMTRRLKKNKLYVTMKIIKMTSAERKKELDEDESEDSDDSDSVDSMD